MKQTSEQKPAGAEGKGAARALRTAWKRVSEAALPAARRARAAAGPLLKAAGRWLKDSFVLPLPEAGRIALDGVLRQNPLLVLLLGICPALGAATCAQNGLGLGVATAAVLLCSSLVISLLRQVVPGQIRILSSLVIIAAFTTAADLLLQAFFPDLSAALGIYVPLMAVSCFILGRTETFACRHKPGAALLDGLFMGLGYTLALTLLGAVREILGTGALWGKSVPVLSQYPVGLALAPCGGFILLGVLAALVQWVRSWFSPRKGGSKA